MKVEMRPKEKALTAYDKPFKSRYKKCGKHRDKSTDSKYPAYKHEK